MRKSILVLAVLLLSGCASQVQQEDLWRFSGKIALRAEGLSRTLTIDWTQRSNTSLINLDGPLGIPVAQITAHDDLIVLNADGQELKLDGRFPLQLESGVELELPWPELRSWVQGRTLDGSKITHNGHRSQGWTVKVLESDESGPIRMRMEHLHGSLQLKVQQWTFSGNIQ